jgi:hypothetical protein
MAQNSKTRKSFAAATLVPTNGTGEDSFAHAETAAPAQNTLDEAQKILETPAIDLNAALGDEDALRHQLLEEGELPIEVRPPRKREFFIVHPAFRRLAELVEYAPDGSLSRAYYLLAPGMKALIEEEDKKTVELVFCCSAKTRGYFWWPINLNPEGRENAWNESSRQVADEIRQRQQWARRLSRRSSGRYTTKWADEGTFGPPTWPNQSRDELLHDAFIKSGHCIDTPQHPVYLDMEGRA